MTSGQIEETVQRFASTARMAETAGFDGVQIHAAHGYLISQFPSPLTNQRRDRWGGTLDNRARLLLDIVAAVRAEVDERSAVGVKLNTADFQRGGFGTDDAARVVAMLAEFPVDLVELSGGSLESLATHGHPADGSTLAREAYFLDAAAAQAAVRCRLARSGRQGAPSGRVPPIRALVRERLHRRTALRRYRSWLSGQRPPDSPVNIVRAEF